MLKCDNENLKYSTLLNLLNFQILSKKQKGNLRLRLVLQVLECSYDFPVRKTPNRMVKYSVTIIRSKLKVGNKLRDLSVIRALIQSKWKPSKVN